MNLFSSDQILVPSFPLSDGAGPNRRAALNPQGSPMINAIRQPNALAILSVLINSFVGFTSRAGLKNPT
jgi:hypothetical protein